jgi:hypothetical protein
LGEYGRRVTRVFKPSANDRLGKALRQVTQFKLYIFQPFIQRLKSSLQSNDTKGHYE